MLNSLSGLGDFCLLVDIRFLSNVGRVTGSGSTKLDLRGCIGFTIICCLRHAYLSKGYGFNALYMVRSGEILVM